MEYLVHTSGEVSKFHNKAYVVKADSKQEAQEIAKQNFKKEFDCVNIDADVQSYARSKRAIAALTIMLVAVVISFFTYKYLHKDPFLYFFSVSKIKEFSIAPDMFSCIYAIVFYSVYVIRFKGIQRTVGSHIDIAFCVLSVLLLSSVFKLILTTDNLKFLGFLPLPGSHKILMIAILASLFGIKLISAGCMAFIAITAVSNIAVANEAMKTWGVIYIMCAFLGTLLYLSVEPAVLEALPQIKKSFANTFKLVKKDFSDAKEEAKSIANNIKK